ncbi:MAG: GNAT family N-acetyltransferase [Chloroflexi bacterium]|nr:GNAT family N-acetyltransferase [Chloroflexota bacterium]
MSKETLKTHIVPIAEDYIEGFYKCLDSVARERQYLGRVEAPPLASVQGFVQSNIAQDIPQFVALRDGEVVGWCDIVPLGLDIFSHCGELGMGVQQAYRRQGIGERLTIATIEKAREKGMERIELEVFASNKVAIKLYEKLGFVVEGVRKRKKKLDGVYDDVVEMALFVA